MKKKSIQVLFLGFIVVFPVIPYNLSFTFLLNLREGLSRKKNTFLLKSKCFYFISYLE